MDDYKHHTVTDEQATLEDHIKAAMKQILE